MKPIQIHPVSALVGVSVFGLLGTAQIATTSFEPLELTAEQKEILSHMSIVFLDDGQGGTTKTIRISDVNVQIVNGLGATNGNPVAPDDTTGTTNGLGNLIVGYNEFGSPFGDDRTGSHCVVVGHGHNYNAFGGIVAGRDNQATGAYACVTGGERNHAFGRFSSISGGGGFNGNEAFGDWSSVSGGSSNSASGDYSSVSGGRINAAVGSWSSILGGGGFPGFEGNRVEGCFATCSGGKTNLVQGESASVCGGISGGDSGFGSWSAGCLSCP